MFYLTATAMVTRCPERKPLIKASVVWCTSASKAVVTLSAAAVIRDAAYLMLFHECPARPCSDQALLWPFHNCREIYNPKHTADELM